MVDKRVIAAGFLGGVAIGVAALQANFSARTAEPVAADVGAANAASAMPKTGTSLADKLADEIMAPINEAAAAPPTFEEFVAAVARDQGGKISLRQMTALAEIYSRMYGGVAPRADRSIAELRPDSVPPLRRPTLTFENRYTELRRAPSLTDLESRRGGSADASASRRYSLTTQPSIDEVPNIGAIDIRSGEYLAPAGPGAYVSTRDGILYAPAGPNGVVDTRTGEFIPVNR